MSPQKTPVADGTLYDFSANHPRLSLGDCLTLINDNQLNLTPKQQNVQSKKIVLE